MGARKKHGNARAISHLAGDRHGPTRLAGQAIDLRQPQPGTLVELLGREKRLKHFWQDVRLYAAAGICHCQSDEFSAKAIRRVLRL
jgi:hypothetical protein